MIHKKIGIFGLLAISVACYLFYQLTQANFQLREYQQYAYLAQSFLQGKLYFIESYSSWWHDAVLMNGNYYWTLGAFPAVLLMPFSAVAKAINTGMFYQGYLQPFLIGVIFILIAKVAQKIGYSKENSLFWGVALCFGTALFGVAYWPNSWFFAQVVTTLLLILSFWEYLNKKRYWVIGIIFGLIFATRPTASVGIIFFILDILFSNKFSLKTSLKNIILMGLSALPFLILVGIYNYARFGSAFEMGYNHQITANVFGYAQQLGLFNIDYLPSNLYYLLLSPPTPVFSPLGNAILVTPFIKADPWGMSIFYTSPIFLWLFRREIIKTKLFLPLILTTVLVSLPIIFYYGVGWYQFGYRYSLDFLPFLLLLLMYNLSDKKMSLAFKSTILISAAFNYYLLTTLFIY